MALYGIMHKNTVEKFLKAQPDAEQARRELEHLYENTTPFHGVRVGAKYTIIESMMFYVLRTEDVRWIYQQSNTTKLYGAITVGRTHAVILQTLTGAAHVVVTKNGAQELLTHLLPKMPQAVFGYSNELVKLWNKEVGTAHPSFSALADLQHAGSKKG